MRKNFVWLFPYLQLDLQGCFKIFVLQGSCYLMTLLHLLKRQALISWQNKNSIDQLSDISWFCHQSATD